MTQQRLVISTHTESIPAADLSNFGQFDVILPLMIGLTADWLDNATLEQTQDKSVSVSRRIVSRKALAAVGLPAQTGG